MSEVNEEAVRLACEHYGFAEDDPKAREIVLGSTMYAYWNHRLAWRALWVEITGPLARLMRRFCK